MDLHFGQFPPVEVMLKHVIEGVSDLYPLLSKIDEALEFIVSDQDVLNGFVSRLVAAVSDIGSEIAALKAQPGSAGLDFSGLDSAVSAVEGLEAPAATTGATGASGASGDSVSGAADGATGSAVSSTV